MLQRDPYPVFRRLREEAPLYYNEQHDFFALSRFDDVENALKDHATFSSARGGILELIKADIELPSGVFIFEDPPIHTAHRGLLSRVFTPKKMNALEPQIRELCAEVLDPLVGSDRLDFVADLGARMPMRVIGMLSASRCRIRRRSGSARTRRCGARRAGRASSARTVRGRHLLRGVHHWRREHPPTTS